MGKENGTRKCDNLPLPNSFIEWNGIPIWRTKCLVNFSGIFRHPTYLGYIFGGSLSCHSSVLAWRIPGTGEPGGLLSMGSHRVRHD